MESEDEATVTTIARYFSGMGADATAAQTMARQLFKRAQQLASEREIELVEATAILLKQIATARQGLAPRLDKGVKPKNP